MMWVWDDNENNKVQRKVIYISELGIPYSIFALTEDKLDTEHFKHCAEIEKQRRMTNKELARWLREKPTREYKRSSRTDIVVYCFYSYIEEDADQEVDENFLIREDDGEWREPLVEE